MKSEKLFRLCAQSILLWSAVGLGYLALKYLSPVLAPFLLSAAVALLLRPFVLWVCKKSRVSQPVVGIVLFFLLVFLLLYGLSAASVYVVQQLSSAVSALLTELNAEENVLTRFFDSVDALKERFPFLDGVLFEGEGTLYEAIVNMARKLMDGISSRLTEGAADFLSALPRGAFAISIAFLSMFYFFKDYRTIATSLMRWLPAEAGARLVRLKGTMLGAASRYVRAYFLLMLLTLVQLLVGFLLLDVDYAFLLSLLIATLDLLPVIGVGLVLLPWAAFSLIAGDTVLGVGLLILYLVMYVVRQIAEPKIVSGFIGLHPLVTLFSIYAGYKLFGVLGMILGPCVAFLIKSFREGWQEREKE